MNQTIIQAKGIEKSFGQLKVLKGIDFSVNRKEVVSIVGASGAGKSTLLQILGTLMRPDAGSLEIDGSSVDNLSGNELSAFRNRKIGFVFQQHHLLPEFTAVENVMIPALIARTSKTEARTRAEELLALLGLALGVLIVVNPGAFANFITRLIGLTLIYEAVVGIVTSILARKTAKSNLLN